MLFWKYLGLIEIYWEENLKQNSLKIYMPKTKYLISSYPSRNNDNRGLSGVNKSKMINGLIKYITIKHYQFMYQM